MFTVNSISIYQYTDMKLFNCLQQQHDGTLS